MLIYSDLNVALLINGGNFHAFALALRQAIEAFVQEIPFIESGIQHFD
jgi:3-dehydroquinate dehydratase